MAGWRQGHAIRSSPQFYGRVGFSSQRGNINKPQSLSFPQLQPRGSESEGLRWTSNSVSQYNRNANMKEKKNFVYLSFRFHWLRVDEVNASFHFTHISFSTNTWRTENTHTQASERVTEARDVAATVSFSATGAHNIRYNHFRRANSGFLSCFLSPSTS